MSRIEGARGKSKSTYKSMMPGPEPDQASCIFLGQGVGLLLNLCYYLELYVS
jgi:hypothetical protein